MLKIPSNILPFDSRICKESNIIIVIIIHNQSLTNDKRLETNKRLVSRSSLSSLSLRFFSVLIVLVFVFFCLNSLSLRYFLSLNSLSLSSLSLGSLSLGSLSLISLSFFLSLSSLSLSFFLVLVVLVLVFFLVLVVVVFKTR